MEILYKEHGVREFVVGRYGRFDRCSANAVREVKHKHEDILLVMLLPYHPAQRFFDLPDGFDDSFYPFEMERIPGKAAIVRANRYMIDHSDFVVAYAKYTGSNTIKYLDYARRRAERKKRL